MIFQESQKSWGGRYMEIMKEVRKLRPNPDTILSYGCSTGEECKTLSSMFPNSNVFGYDIIGERVDIAQKRFPKLRFIKEVSGQFDVVFCMSVLCKCPGVNDLKNCSPYLKFEDFERELEVVGKAVCPDGLLVLYNSNFRLMDTGLFNKYSTLYQCKQQLPLFDRKNRRLDFFDTQVILKKTG